MPVISHGLWDVTAVALSFDDGPGAHVTREVLDILKTDGARATFFTIGRHLEAHPETPARILAKEHELDNHSYSHQHGKFSQVTHEGRVLFIA